MAISDDAFESRKPAIGSYETALCLIPHAHLCQNIDRLRALYDNAYGRWPAHINVIYPFVSIDSLPKALQIVQAKLANLGAESRHTNIHLRLDKSDHFSHRHGDTIYIAPGDDGGGQSLKYLRSVILEGFENGDQAYHPHLTIGQNQAQDSSSREHLLAKANLLLPIEWSIEDFVVLVREWTHRQESMSNHMTVWGTIRLAGQTAMKALRSSDFHEKPHTEEWSDKEDRPVAQELSSDTNTLQQSLRRNVDNTTAYNMNAQRTLTRQPRTTYQFSATTATWEPVHDHWVSVSPPGEAQVPITFSISSYNVLVDSIYPPVRDRYALLLRAILSESARAEVLVLQEVSDDFLSYLLGQGTIQSCYPFTTHGPPDQEGIGPLPSLRNIVVLSRWNFSWAWVPFERRHKGAVVLIFDTVGKLKGNDFLPLVVAGVHLTCGLTDGAVAAKKSQLQTLMSHLSRDYAENPWVVAGDFNVTTSATTIDTALKNKSISPQTASVIFHLGTILSDARLSDSWFAARAEIGETLSPGQNQIDFENLNEGEQGATFDPTVNPLAAVSSGQGSNNRAQRYDRILVKGEDFLRVTGFSMFGFPEESDDKTENGKVEDREAVPRCGSDHWGIRATLETNPNSGVRELDDANAHLTSLQFRKASSNLSDVHALKSCLTKLSMFPTDEEIKKRKEAFTLVKSILQQRPVQEHDDTEDKNRSIVSMVVVPVGSYGLGVWSTSSDIDCLCIGSISAKIFFTLASQRLRKAADLGVKILRKVTATSGTMLELDVRDIKFDLQYCPATRIAERWPEAIQLHPSDPLFDLPTLSLTKLKSFRDLDYLHRTIPDIGAFRIAHRFIRAWAKQRGIYSSKFGYLGGFYITLMLSRICKLLFHDAGAITAADLICTFFNHYANFDWKTQIVFDPFFHKQQPRYRRSGREPMVLLGPHTPNINVAHTASFPSLTTLVGELKRADQLLSEVGMTWPKLIGCTENEAAMPDLPIDAQEFLRTYDSYIKINVQYWGLSLAKGSSLVGWLESRCVLLLIDVNRKLPNIHARIWPARFTLNETTDEEERDYEGCYLIGLARMEKAEAQATKETDGKVAEAALWMSLERFADQIRGDEKYFDATSSWVDVMHVKKSQLGDLKLDDRQWGNHVIQEDGSDSEDEEEEPNFNLGDDSETATSLFAKKKKKQPASKSTSQPTMTNKLRPAVDIFNRLRWDPNLDSSDYVIGYEDRFLGTREIALDRWKTEKTDEEFIPQHRILYFRRTDGVMVWERETRRDDIFGSGVGRGL